MNLSTTFKITPPQLALLSKGLTFIPVLGTSAKKQILQTRWDIQEYHRRIKLAAYFENDKDSDPPPFTPRSHWVPPTDALPQEIVSLVKTDLQAFSRHFRPRREFPNLTEDEAEALRELRDNKHIVIKPADKGSVVVICSREQYLWEGYRQLNDKKYYLKLKKPIYLDTIPMIQKIAQTLYEKKYINAKQRSYLIGKSEPRARRFYMLPKIHKDPAKWSKPYVIPPGRPIVSDCDSETYYTAEYLDYYLNPLSVKHPSYIKDTYDFVGKIKKLQIPNQAILFTMDIDSLYTNIDIREGIQAIKNIFHKYPDKHRPDKELLQLLEINLTRNDFEFNGEFFLQVKGTAMGKKFAPAYANIFMAEWETSALASCQKRPSHYYRYLDDIWGIWTHSEEDFESFLTTLNTHNKSITLKSNISHESVNFLDTTTCKGPNFNQTHTLDIKVFFKETDTHALLHKTSFHPKHTYAGLVKSQLLRFHRICTQQSDFEEATRTLFTALRPRGYCRSFLRKSYKDFLRKKSHSDRIILPFVTTYSSAAIRLIRMIKDNFQSVLGGKQALQNYRVIAAFKKNKNLQNILIKAQIRPLQTPNPKSQGQFFKHSMWVQNKYTQEVFKTCHHGSLNSKNCVYLITCKQCGIQYVGETGNSISVRFTQHRHNILRHKETGTPLVQHYIMHGWQSTVVSVLEQNPNWSVLQRRRAEKTWIYRLGTLHPGGLNERRI